MILDILNLLALIEWIALGVVVWFKARSLYRRSKAVLDALQSEETEVYEDEAETLLESADGLRSHPERSQSSHAR